MEMVYYCPIIQNHIITDDINILEYYIANLKLPANYSFKYEKNN